MTRIPIAAGNWKMHFGPQQGAIFAALLRAQLDNLTGVVTVLFPPFVTLPAVAQAIAGSTLQLGAQNCADQAGGAFTGEVAAPMIAELAGWVILGHSERRAIQGESNDLINIKLQVALSAGLQPIVCVGERLEDREANLTERVITSQIRGSLADLRDDQISRLVIAYEPVWAIGTGRAATRQDAEDAIGVIRALLAERYGTAPAAAVRVLYGGSVTAANVREFVASPAIDGALVGGASLKPEFVAIAQTIAAAKQG